MIGILDGDFTGVGLGVAVWTAGLDFGMAVRTAGLDGIKGTCGSGAGAAGSPGAGVCIWARAGVLGWAAGLIRCDVWTSGLGADTGL